MNRLTLTLTMILATASSGCALLSKQTITEPRYFTPEVTRSAPRDALLRPGLDLRLGRVTSGAHLGERIVFRPTAQEIVFYNDRRWTEKPVTYLRRALTRVLFEEAGLGSVISGPGPTLDVELVRFEEVLTPVHVARVRLALSLRDARVVRLQETLDIEVTIPATSEEEAPAAAAGAFGEALDAAVNELARQVIDRLSSPVHVDAAAPEPR